MATLLPLVRALGRLRQMTAGDSLRLPGAINQATPVIYAVSGTVLDWNTIAANTATSPGVSTVIASMTGASDGALRMIRFGADHTLQHTASVLELPGNAHITTQFGDSAMFLRRSSTRWQCLFYQRSDGTALVATAVPDATKLPLAGGRMTGAIEYAGYGTITAADNMNIAAVNANTVRIDSDSPVTINAFGTGVSGTRRILFFNTAQVTLLHDPSLTILPGNASIVPAIGDFAEFQCEGGATWRCMWYQRRTGAALVGSPDATKLPLAGGTLSGAVNEAPLTTLASAATTNIGAATSNTVTISGTTTITSLGTKASGAVRALVFSGVLTLTHNATSLILPGGANIVTAAGDSAEFVSLGSGNWRCLRYTRASGAALVGGSMTTYTWTQASALATWTIPHNLGRFPSVTVVNGLGEKVEPDITYTDANTVTVTHSAALAGKAYLN